MKNLLLAFLVLCSYTFAQNKDPYKILNSIKERFNKIKDYQVDAQIKVDVDFIKAPDMKAKIYFKAPDKLKLDSKDFAMLPKQAFNFSPMAFLDKGYNSIYSSTEGKSTAVIKIIPTSDSSDFILTTLWIDTDKNLVQKIESTGKRGVSSRVELKYSGSVKYPLPSQIKFYFEISSMHLPNPDPRRKDSNNKKSNEKQSGNVTITYSNYQVNRGIPDSIFKEKVK